MCRLTLLLIFELFYLFSLVLSIKTSLKFSKDIKQEQTFLCIYVINSQKNLKALKFSTSIVNLLNTRNRLESFVFLLDRQYKVQLNKELRFVFPKGKAFRLAQEFSYCLQLVFSIRESNKE